MTISRTLSCESSLPFANGNCELRAIRSPSSRVTHHLLKALLFRLFSSSPFAEASFVINHKWTPENQSKRKLQTCTIQIHPTHSSLPLQANFSLQKTSTSSSQ